MLKIGITGGIGSGKTTVCKLFELLEIPVYFADERAKWLMQNNTILKGQLHKKFGEAIFEDGVLQTKKLATKVFTNEKALNELNELVHPAVFNDFEKWVTEQINTTPFILHEAALIFETDFDQKLDKVITVYAPEKMRIERVIKRDKATENAIRHRMKQQLPEEDKIQRSQFVIYNDEKQLVTAQVIAIYNKLKSMN